MKQVLDCAILHFGQQLDPGAVTQLSEVQHKLKHRRLRCHELDLSERLMISDELLFREDDRQFLLMQLLRYDVAVFILSTETLSLARRFLFYLHCAEELNKGFCPMIALATGVQSVAMIDLMRLGLSDFMHSPVDHDELRVRLFASVNKPLLRVSTDSEVVDPSRQSSSAAAISYFPQHEPKREFFEDLLRDVEQQTGHYAFAFSDSQAVYFAESFKEAKQNVVDRFEHGYLSYMLRSTNGNIAQAAILAKKNRRSFWELMRKHKIDAEEFRPEL